MGSASDDILPSTVIGSLPGETAVDTQLLGELIARITHTGRIRGLAGALSVADIVLDGLFAGSLASFKAASRTHETFRALQAHPDLALSKTALWYAIAVRDQLQVLPAPLAEDLPLSHHKVLLAVESPIEKVALARRACREHLSRRELERIVRTRTPSTIVRGPGRPPTPAVIKGLRRVEQAIDLATSEPLSPRVVRALDRARVAHLLKSIARHVDALDALRRDLERLSHEG